MSLTAIYATAVVTGVLAVGYINTGINELIVKPAAPQPAISVQQPTGQQRLVVGPNVQPAYLYSTQLLQPTTNGQKTFNPQSNQTGGNGQNYELQPALGYRVLQ